MNAFTVDVESWFNILDLPNGPDPSTWSRLEDRDTEHTIRLLNLLDRQGVLATCFISGWTAEHRPGLLEDIVWRGHEIACHGYGHQLLYGMTPEEFREDLERARAVIRRCYSGPIDGYRAPGFSLTEATPWAFEVIADAGFRYDSSVFPAQRGHGGLPGARCLPHVIKLPDGRRLREFPISTTTILGRRTAYVGGGYLRLFPYELIRRWVRQANEAGEPVIVYIHPRDIDPDQPRLPMPLMRRFKSYVNLGTTFSKLERLLQDFAWGPAHEVLNHALSNTMRPAWDRPAIAEGARGTLHANHQRLRSPTQLHEDRPAHAGLQGL